MIVGYAAAIVVTCCLVAIAARQVVRLVSAVAPRVAPALHYEARNMVAEYDEMRHYADSKASQVSSELACLRVALNCLGDQEGIAQMSP